MELSIADRVFKHLQANPSRPALTVDNITWSYSELLTAAGQLAQKLPKPSPNLPLPVTAVIADRRPSSYLGICASILRGNTYVPVNPLHPVSHNADVIRRSGASTIILSRSSDQLLDCLRASDEKLLTSLEIIYCEDAKTEFDFDLALEVAPYNPLSGGREYAYILFTSGSTGVPKGVPISHRNLSAYLAAADGVLTITPNDRLSQTFELTFDLSVHDLMLSFTSGAHLVVPSREQLLSPGDYIKRYEITCWFSVPSLAYQMDAQNALTEGAFPSLRFSLFCGEALPVDIAKSWSVAAKNSIVENWYGPTEATIACARFRTDAHYFANATSGELVPIGKPMGKMSMTVCDQALSPVSDGTEGELLLSGPQVSDGYLDDPQKTSGVFVNRKHQSCVFYRTGDLAVKIDDSVSFLGRIDNQAKIRGFRIELGAVEAAIRSAHISPLNVIAISWPPDKPSGNTVLAAIEGQSFDTRALSEQLTQKLPEYMLPSRYFFLNSFPKNASGKTDRRAVTSEIKTFVLRSANQVVIDRLPREKAGLMELILQASPSLDIEVVLKSDSLIAAGMDSLSFVSLTAAIEKLIKLDFTQEIVAEMSEMSFSQLHSFLYRGKADASEVTPKLRSQRKYSRLQYRANRAIQFIERFPGLAHSQSGKAVLAIGSSGIAHGFDPKTFDEQAKKLGNSLTSVNIGLPAINIKGISRICRFIADICNNSDVDCSLIIYELDPMHISTRPPAGDIELSDSHFNGTVESFIDDVLDPELSWTVENRGAGVFSENARRVKGSPQWQKKRAREILATYLGEAIFDDRAVEAWALGAEYLSSITRNVVGFVHPIDVGELAENSMSPGKDLKHIISELTAKTGLPFVDHDDFDLSDGDFLNINHVTPWQGRENLTRQLANKCLSQSISIQKG